MNSLNFALFIFQTQLTLASYLALSLILNKHDRKSPQFEGTVE